MQRKDLPENSRTNKVITLEDKMNFSYRYSAIENKEVQEIRKKYLPQDESKMDELKRLDRYVQVAGQLPSLTVGIIGCFVFGLGLCLAMQNFGESILLGVLLGIIGSVGMITAYPIFCSVSQKAKAEYTPRILKLTDELMIK